MHNEDKSEERHDCILHSILQNLLSEYLHSVFRNARELSLLAPCPFIDIQAYL